MPLPRWTTTLRLGAVYYRDSEGTLQLLRPLWIPGGVGSLNTVEASVAVLRVVIPDSDYRFEVAPPRRIWLADLGSLLCDLDWATRYYNDEVSLVKNPSKSVRVAAAAVEVRNRRTRLHVHGLTDEQIDLAVRLSATYDIRAETEALWDAVAAITAG